MPADPDISREAIEAIIAAPWCYPSAALSDTIRALAIRSGILTPVFPAGHRRLRCAECFREIDPISRTGHLRWCPYEGYPEYPEVLL